MAAAPTIPTWDERGVLKHVITRRTFRNEDAHAFLVEVLLRTIRDLAQQKTVADMNNNMKKHADHVSKLLRQAHHYPFTTMAAIACRICVQATSARADATRTEAYLDLYKYYDLDRCSDDLAARVILCAWELLSPPTRPFLDMKLWIVRVFVGTLNHGHARAAELLLRTPLKRKDGERDPNDARQKAGSCRDRGLEEYLVTHVGLRTLSWVRQLPAATVPVFSELCSRICYVHGRALKDSLQDVAYVANAALRNGLIPEFSRLVNDLIWASKPDTSPDIVLALFSGSIMDAADVPCQPSARATLFGSVRALLAQRVDGLMAQARQPKLHNGVDRYLDILVQESLLGKLEWATMRNGGNRLTLQVTVQLPNDQSLSVAYVAWLDVVLELHAAMFPSQPIACSHSREAICKSGTRLNITIYHAAQKLDDKKRLQLLDLWTACKCLHDDPDDPNALRGMRLLAQFLNAPDRAAASGDEQLVRAALVAIRRRAYIPAMALNELPSMRTTMRRLLPRALYPRLSDCDTDALYRSSWSELTMLVNTGQLDVVASLREVAGILRAKAARAMARDVGDLARSLRQYMASVLRFDAQQARMDAEASAMDRACLEACMSLCAGVEADPQSSLESMPSFDIDVARVIAGATAFADVDPYVPSEHSRTLERVIAAVSSAEKAHADMTAWVQANAPVRCGSEHAPVRCGVCWFLLEHVAFGNALLMPPPDQQLDEDTLLRVVVNAMVGVGDLAVVTAIDEMPIAVKTLRDALLDVVVNNALILPRGDQLVEGWYYVRFMTSKHGAFSHVFANEADVLRTAVTRHWFSTYPNVPLVLDALTLKDFRLYTNMFDPMRLASASTEADRKKVCEELCSLVACVRDVDRAAAIAEACKLLQLQLQEGGGGANQHSIAGLRPWLESRVDDTRAKLTAQADVERRRSVRRRLEDGASAVEPRQ